MATLLTQTLTCILFCIRFFDFYLFQELGSCFMMRLVKIKMIFWITLGEGQVRKDISIVVNQSNIKSCGF